MNGAVVRGAPVTLKRECRPDISVRCRTNRREDGSYEIENVRNEALIERPADRELPGNVAL